MACDNDSVHSMRSVDQLHAWLGHDRISRDGVLSAEFDASTQKTMYSAGLMPCRAAAKTAKHRLSLLDGSNAKARWIHAPARFRHDWDYTYYTIWLQTLDKFSAEVHCAVSQFPPWERRNTAWSFLNFRLFYQKKILISYDNQVLKEKKHVLGIDSYASTCINESRKPDELCGNCVFFLKKDHSRCINTWFRYPFVSSSCRHTGVQIE